ncbi:MAG: hypothetical protein DRP09_17575 [Candidatus Thorarchaeota archaeon]|nr:MAG: hypothetical protein DRP09_17575 [Candidatus Thorarchaeota archaeon]
MKKAVFTIVKDESQYLPIWMRHYSKYFKQEDIFVLDDSSADKMPFKLLEDYDHSVIEVFNQFSFDVHWLASVVADMQRSLLTTRGYDMVLFAEADEIIIPNKKFENHLKDNDIVRCTGYEVIHQKGEKVIDWDKKLLKQRKGWFRNPRFDKPLLSKVACAWTPGFHTCRQNPNAPIDDSLILIHLRRIDYGYTYDRLAKRRKWKRPPGQAVTMAHQWGLEMEDFDRWFYDTKAQIVDIPAEYKNVC